MKPPGTRRKLRVDSVLTTRLTDGATYSPSCLPVYGESQYRSDMYRKNIFGNFKGVENSFVVTTMRKAIASGGDGLLLITSGGVPYQVVGGIAGMSCYTSFLKCMTWDIVAPQDAFGLDTLARDRSILKAHANMTPSKIELGVALAELGDTVRLIRSPLSGLVKMLTRWERTAKRRAFKEFGRAKFSYKHFFNALADTWLEFRLGVMPLWYDVLALRDIANQGFEMLISKRLRESVGKARSTRSRAVSLGGYPMTYWPDKTVSINWTGSVECLQRSYCSVYYEEQPIDANTYALLQLGLDSTQIPSVLWETTPFSFVVDRFWDIGTWIKAWQPKPYAKILCSSHTHKIVNRFVVNGTPVSTGYQQVTGGLGSTILELSELLRAENFQLPLTPGVNPTMLKIQQEFDHLALIWANAPKFFKFKR